MNFVSRIRILYDDKEQKIYTDFFYFYILKKLSRKMLP